MQRPPCAAACFLNMPRSDCTWSLFSSSLRTKAFLIATSLFSSILLERMRALQLGMHAPSMERHSPSLQTLCFMIAIWPREKSCLPMMLPSRKVGT